MKSYETARVSPQVRLQYIRNKGAVNQTHFSGVFVDNAMALVPSPPWTVSQLESYLETAVQDVLGVGLTSVHDAASLPEYIDTFAK